MGKKKSKRLSNPFSTGGGGGHFEAHVQASFVALMLTKGFAPCIPNLPITKIKLQGKFDGYDTDDLIIFTEDSKNNLRRKVLGQVKHTVNISDKDIVFGEIIQSAWNDFNNHSLFSKETDVIALITGPLSASDINDTRTVLEWARQSETADEFFKKVSLTYFSSMGKQRKLQAFKVNLEKANNGSPIPDEILFDFLKHFHILSYDLDLVSGVTLSLIYSLLGQYSIENTPFVWSRIVEEVQSANKNAGTISLENLPTELKGVFIQKSYEIIPDEFSSPQTPSDKIDWGRLPYASELAIVNLLGSWNDQNQADLKVIEELTNKDSESWLSSIREILHNPTSPLVLRNGKWHITQREALWDSLSIRIFDKDLENFKTSVVHVLTERDPQFDLPIEERFAASIHGKTLKTSSQLRKGMAESLAILGNRSKSLINCSLDKPEFIAISAVREILKDADWVVWGSLNDLLPFLAEAAPNEFLDAVEDALQKSPSPFDQLFPRKGGGVFANRNYLTGLLWALETLAWDEEFLVRVSVILGDLSTHDPGESNWVNRPSNSLRTIFLPWFPQTTANIEKRKVAIQTLEKEFPQAAWTLLLSLLPNQHQMTSGSHKPIWRTNIPDEWGKRISGQEYWEQIFFYSDLLVSLAARDINKLNEIINNLDNLPKPSFDRVLQLLSSDDIYNNAENQRFKIWTNLTKFVTKHKRFSDAKWSLPTEVVSKIEEVSLKLAPTDPLTLHRRLFSERDFDLFEENENWEEQRQKLEERRKLAIDEIISHGGINAVLQFAESIDSSATVGAILGLDGKPEIDKILLPKYLDIESEKLTQLVRGYIWNSQRLRGWLWVDSIDKTNWSESQINLFLTSLPFTSETWNRATLWLGNIDKEYWKSVNVNPYEADINLEIAIDNLIKHGRPNAAIDCLSKILHEKKPLNKDLSARALLAAVNTQEPSHAMDVHNSTELIKVLQNDPETDPDELFKIEWAYLPILDGYSGAYPKLLATRLASDPSFFCEVIRIIYRSKKEEKPKSEISESDKAIATNAWRLLHEWKIPPGTLPDGSFSGEYFIKWLENAKTICNTSGHLEVALTHIGHVLFYSPPDPQGLWINQSVANALNEKDAEDMRNGFSIEAFNSRGVQWVDPTGKPEKELAELYRNKAESVENAGYQRFSSTLRKLAEGYERDAERIIAEHKDENDFGIE